MREAREPHSIPFSQSPQSRAHRYELALMSIAIVEREVLKFLRSDEPGVLCITGTWGVGKTHAWTRRYLARARAESIASVSKYSYVSLFGLNSLEQFRQNLIIGALTRDLDRIAPGSIFDKGKRMLQSLAEPLQKFSKFGQYSGLLASVAFNLLDGQLFCIDDLERKGVGLSIKDILGLVTQLKEEKKCKVVIILNVGDLEGTDKDEFQTYHEKVIDLSLTYAPTPEECAHIALSNSEVDQLIAKCAVELRISNIRILKKIQARVVQIAELVGDYDTRIFEPIVRSIVLLSWCVYAPTEAPSLEFLKAYQLRGVRKGNEAQPGPAETQWNSVLTSYGF